MWYKVKKKSELPDIIIGKRMTNKDSLLKAFNKGYNDGFEAGLNAAGSRIKELEAKIGHNLELLNYIAKNGGIKLEKDQLNKQLEQAEQEAVREVLQELKKMFGTSREFNFSDRGTAWETGNIGNPIRDKLERVAKKRGIELE